MINYSKIYIKPGFVEGLIPMKIKHNKRLSKINKLLKNI